MTLSPEPVRREATPEERRRSIRAFWVILFLFLSGVGAIVAFLSLKGRQVREYGHSVYVAASERPWTASGLVERPCSEFSSAPLPAHVKTCTVEVQDGAVTVVLKMDDQRQYRVNK